MFSKKKRTNGTQKKTETRKKTKPPSIISEGMIVSGDLFSEGEIQIDGRVEGDIRCESLYIGINGVILGGIKADNVRIHGTITGQVLANAVYLASTAHMTGDVTHESLAIEPGAFVEGLCRRVNDPIPAEERSPDLMITDERLREVAGNVKNLPTKGADNKNDKQKKKA